jgi:hypothetical protein
MRSDRLGAAERKALAKRIVHARDSLGLTNGQLASKAGCGERSVRKLVKGESTGGKVRAEVCVALEIPIDHEREDGVSDGDHGGYTLENFSEFVGHYFVYRRSQRFPKNILRSVFDISWDNKRQCLIFEEHQRYHSAETHSDIDNSQNGDIFHSNTIGLLHFVSQCKGAVRLITVSKFRLNNPSDLTMHGIVLTQAKMPFHYQPFAAAIIFQKTSKLAGSSLTHGAKLFRPSDLEHSQINLDLIEVERHMATFALGMVDPTAIQT